MYYHRYSKEEIEYTKKYSHILKKSPSYFINSPKADLYEYSFDEVRAISFVLARYYKNNPVNHENQVIFFEFTFRDVKGADINTRNKRLSVGDYIFNKLSKRKETHNESVLFHKEKGEYCSVSCVEKYKNKLKKREEFLSKRMLVVNENLSISMNEMIETQQQSKLSEVYLTNTMLEQMASNEGRSWMMITLTAPGKYHINPVKGKNRWNKDCSPIECDSFLTRAYRAAYKALKKDVERSKIEEIYGAWSKEPHKSGAIHMHVLFYVLPNEVERYKELFTNALRNSFKREGERFYKNTSINFKTQNKDFIEYDKDGNVTKKAGSGASYLFKYIMKSLNVMEFKPQEGKRIKIEDGDKIAAHNSMYNYKRFSFVGVNSCFTKWRLTRQIFKDFEKNPDGEILPDTTKIIFDIVKNNDIAAFSQLEDVIKIDYKETLNYYGETIKTPIGIFIEKEYYLKPKKTIITKIPE